MLQADACHYARWSAGIAARATQAAKLDYYLNWMQVSPPVPRCLPRQHLSALVAAPRRGFNATAAPRCHHLLRQIRTGVFNHGQYRRKRLPAHQKAQFYDPDDAEGSRLRQEFADEAMKDMLAFFDDRGGQVTAAPCPTPALEPADARRLPARRLPPPRLAHSAAGGAASTLRFPAQLHRNCDRGHRQPPPPRTAGQL